MPSVIPRREIASVGSTEPRAYLSDYGYAHCKAVANVKLLIIDELGYVPFTVVRAELLSRCSAGYEHGATLVTSNLLFDEWTSVLGSQRLTGALLDRSTVGFDIHSSLSGSRKHYQR